MHPLTDHLLPGLDAERLERLVAAGLGSLEDLVRAGPERLAELTGFDPKTCRALVRVARVATKRDEPAVIELLPGREVRDEPASVRLARGLGAARDLERAVSQVRNARSHAGRRPARKRWAKVHGKARRQLQKLLEALHGLQRSVLSDGLSVSGHEHLMAGIAELDRSLHPLVEAPIRRRTLKRMRDAAKRARYDLTVS